jgi:RNase P/RNase MRP subunit POP5
MKRRYLALQLDIDSSINPEILMDRIWSSIVKLYGEYGASKTNLKLIDFEYLKKTAIIRTNLSSLNIVRSSLVTITSFMNMPVSLHVLAISGTIKALKKKLKILLN